MGLKVVFKEVDTSGQQRRSRFREEVRESGNGIYLGEDFFGGTRGVTLGGSSPLYSSDLRSLVSSYNAPLLGFHQGQARITYRGLEFTIREKGERIRNAEVEVLSRGRLSKELLPGKVYELRISSIILTLTVIG